MLERERIAGATSPSVKSKRDKRTASVVYIDADFAKLMESERDERSPEFRY